MSKSKFYAVVKGRNHGIYTTWKEAEAQVKGFSGPIYKSFNNKKDAEEFINNSTITVKHDQAKEISDKTIIYTDGSCIDKICGFGIVILAPSKGKYTYYGKVPLCAFDNVKKQQYNDVAELYAIYAALTFINGDAILYTDCKYAVVTLTSYINSWIKDNSIKTRENSKLLLAIYDQMKNRNIEFQHVNSHIGIKYNEECDKLADNGRLMITDELISSFEKLQI
jgi:ribonuclease HI